MPKHVYGSVPSSVVAVWAYVSVDDARMQESVPSADRADDDGFKSVSEVRINGVIEFAFFGPEVVRGGVDVDVGRNMRKIFPGARNFGVAFFLVWRGGGPFPQLGEDRSSDPEDDHFSEVAHVGLEKVQDENVFAL